MKVALAADEQNELYDAVDQLLRAKEHYKEITKELAMTYKVKRKTIRVDSFAPFMYAEAK